MENQTSTIIDESFFTGVEEKTESDANKISDLQKSFSPKQIGSIAKYIEPVNANFPIEDLMQMFKDQEDLMVVPVEEYDHVVGVIDRKTTAALTNTAWKRFTAKNVGDYALRVYTILYANDFIEKALQKVSEINKEYDINYFPVFYNKSFYGIVSLDNFLSRIAEIREQDLTKASFIQQSFLTSKSLESKLPYRFKAWNKMANALGGDFYQVYPLSETKSLICCFDVSGKNVAASLLTITTGSFFKLLSLLPESEKDPIVIISLLDEYLQSTVPTGNFITALICFVDLDEKKIMLFNCGHTMTYLLYKEDEQSSKGKMSTIKPGLPPLGIGAVKQELAGISLSHGTLPSTITVLPIMPSMHLNMYTDGFTDMQNDDGIRYEDKAAKNFFIKLYGVKDDEICSTIEKTVTSWIQNAMIPDDITVIDVRF